MIINEKNHMVIEILDRMIAYMETKIQYRKGQDREAEIRERLDMESTNRKRQDSYVTKNMKLNKGDDYENLE